MAPNEHLIRMCFSGVMVGEGRPPTTLSFDTAHNSTETAAVIHTMLPNHYYVYIMSNRRNGTLYVGVTNDLVRRCQEHCNGTGGAFTKKYGLTRLVYYEHHNDIEQAISREKRIKTWLRAWKVRLIHQQNPEWSDLAPNLLNELPMT